MFLDSKSILLLINLPQTIEYKLLKFSKSCEYIIFRSFMMGTLRLRDSDLEEFNPESLRLIIGCDMARRSGVLNEKYRFLIDVFEGKDFGRWNKELDIRKAFMWLIDCNIKKENLLKSLAKVFVERRSEGMEYFEPIIFLIRMYVSEDELPLSREVLMLIKDMFASVREKKITTYIHGFSRVILGKLFARRDYAMLEVFVDILHGDVSTVPSDELIPFQIPLCAVLDIDARYSKLKMLLIGHYLKMLDLAIFFDDFKLICRGGDGRHCELLDLFNQTFLNVIGEGYISNYIYFLQTFPEYANIKNDTFRKLCDSQNLISSINPDGLRNIYKSIKDTDSKFEFEIGMLLYSKINIETEKYYEGNSYREFIIRVATSLRDKGNKLTDFENVNPFKGSKYLEGIIKGNVDENSPYASSLSKINNKKPHNQKLIEFADMVNSFLRGDELHKVTSLDKLKEICENSIDTLCAKNDIDKTQLLSCLREYVEQMDKYFDIRNGSWYSIFADVFGCMLESVRYYGDWALYFNFVQNNEFVPNLVSFDAISNYPILYIASSNDQSAKLSEFNMIYKLVAVVKSCECAVFQINFDVFDNAFRQVEMEDQINETIASLDQRIKDIDKEIEDFNDSRNRVLAESKKKFETSRLMFNRLLRNSYKGFFQSYIENPSALDVATLYPEVVELISNDMSFCRDIAELISKVKLNKKEKMIYRGHYMTLIDKLKEVLSQDDSSNEKTLIAALGKKAKEISKW